ncbi:hypothetical protein IQ265_23960 [Nodosilinea sp. LEGE 06152]|uniref:hypothetical protein n=1 Tax=Nodosilinea sp. LEGE 06152 TaxID=2777966 RepID=UPI0018813B77|nr:hypothetical protein [Nodosilinea sp. LEGE 06152]MBE9159865.1 hypothetical protein [Nodosilinea sp. LEGE 06152]
MTLKVRFAGDFAQDRKVPMGIMSHTLFYTEKAFERAYLDVQRNGLRKNEKMHSDDYARAVLLFENIEYSSVGFKFVELSSDLIPSVNRLIKSLLSSYEKAAQEGDLKLSDVKEQVITQRRILEARGDSIVPSYANFVENPGGKILGDFGDRSINKYIDQAIVPIRKHEGDGIIEFSMKGDELHTFSFNAFIAERFGKIISHKTLGEPFILSATLISADNNLKAKVYNTISRRQMNVFFSDLDELVYFSPFIGRKGEQFQFIAAPVIESGTYDVTSGDVYFLKFMG